MALVSGNPRQRLNRAASEAMGLPSGSYGRRLPALWILILVIHDRLYAQDFATRKRAHDFLLSATCVHSLRYSLLARLGIREET
jgi:hypothetical protein